MLPLEVFLPFASFEPTDATELPLTAGHPVLVLNREESPHWYYGRDTRTGQEVSERDLASPSVSQSVSQSARPSGNP